MNRDKEVNETKVPCGRFDYLKYDSHATEKQLSLKSKFEELEALVENMLRPGRAKALCLTALEEAYMWTGKSIRDDQAIRTGNVEAQEERSNQ